MSFADESTLGAWRRLRLLPALICVLFLGGCGGGGSSSASVSASIPLSGSAMPSHAPISTATATPPLAPAATTAPVRASTATPVAVAATPTPAQATTGTPTPANVPTPAPAHSPTPPPSPTPTAVPPAIATYFVDPAGNDTNPGTAAAPFATIQKAADVAQPGNTVIVNNGTYTGKNPAGCSATQQCYVALISTSGAPGKPITFTAANRLGASIDGNADSTPYCIGLNSNVAYINIVGFEITHCGVSGVSINSANHDVLVQHNHIEHIAETNTCSLNGNAGIGTGAGTFNITIDANTVNDVGRLPTSGCAPASLVYTNDHLLYLRGHNQTITNNVLYDAHSGWSLQLGCGPPPDGPGWLIANNTIGSSNNPQAYGDIVVDDTGGGSATSSGIISNNIALHPATVFFDLFNPNPNANWTMDNNLFGTNVALAGGQGAANATITSSGNIDNTNPLVASTALPNPNYALLAGSPAIGAGYDLPAVTHDFTGAARGNPPSIGAFEQ